MSVLQEAGEESEPEGRDGARRVRREGRHGRGGSGGREARRTGSEGRGAMARGSAGDPDVDAATRCRGPPPLLTSTHRLLPRHESPSDGRRGTRVPPRWPQFGLQGVDSREKRPSTPGSCRKAATKEGLVWRCGHRGGTRVEPPRIVRWPSWGALSRRDDSSSRGTPPTRGTRRAGSILRSAKHKHDGADQRAISLTTTQRPDFPDRRRPSTSRRAASPTP